jgi:hypothetical protein
MVPESRCFLIRSSVCWIASTRLAMPLFTRRVPLYVSLPVIIGCGAAGYVASTWQPGLTNNHSVSSHLPAQPSPTSVVASTLPEPRERQFSPVSGTAPPGALPIEEIDLPMPVVPVAKAAERLETDPDAQPAPPASVTVTIAAPRPLRAGRPVQSTSKTRPLRTTQQRTAPPPSGLKSIPIIGAGILIVAVTRPGVPS